MNRKSILAYPYVIWSSIFIVIPLLLVVFFSFSIETDNGYIISLQNYKDLIDPLYLKVFFRSITLAGLSTFICLLVGYPVAYIISKMH
ncbi:MAG: ABC transporter permease, partial [Paraclostridium sp.]